MITLIDRDKREIGKRTKLTKSLFSQRWLFVVFSQKIRFRIKSLDRRIASSSLVQEISKFLIWRNLLCESHKHIWNAIECFSSSVGFANKTFDTSGIFWSSVDQPIAGFFNWNDLKSQKFFQCSFQILLDYLSLSEKLYSNLSTT